MIEVTEEVLSVEVLLSLVFRFFRYLTCHREAVQTKNRQILDKDRGGGSVGQHIAPITYRGATFLNSASFAGTIRIFSGENLTCLK